MKIQLLNVRVQIERSQVVTDEIGNRTTGWIPYYTCFATVSGEGGQESDGAGVVLDMPTMDFTIRWCEAARSITATGYRVRFEDAVYDILAVDHMNYKRKSIKLRCRKESRS